METVSVHQREHGRSVKHKPAVTSWVLVHGSVHQSQTGFERICCPNSL